jgi:hypothetical protein
MMLDVSAQSRDQHPAAGRYGRAFPPGWRVLFLQRPAGYRQAEIVAQLTPHGHGSAEGSRHDEGESIRTCELWFCCGVALCRGRVLPSWRRRRPRLPRAMHGSGFTTRTNARLHGYGRASARCFGLCGARATLTRLSAALPAGHRPGCSPRRVKFWLTIIRQECCCNVGAFPCTSSSRACLSAVDLWCAGECRLRIP